MKLVMSNLCFLLHLETNRNVNSIHLTFQGVAIYARYHMNMKYEYLVCKQDVLT